MAVLMPLLNGLIYASLLTTNWGRVPGVANVNLLAGVISAFWLFHRAKQGHRNGPRPTMW